MEIDHSVRIELMNKLSGSGGWRQRLKCKWRVGAWEMTVGLVYLVKRGVDLAGAVILMVLLVPLFLVTALVIYLEDPGPVFYVHARVGKNGKHFPFYKFRSMIIGADMLKDQLIEKNESQDGVIFKIREDPRVTKVGKIIRKFSIDELPQLLNVVRGDMSLVGPRPALPREVASYSLEQRKRLHVLPGITGSWQVSGRSDIPFTGQVRLDLEYIGSRSLKNDIIILLKTIPAVLGGRGAY